MLLVSLATYSEAEIRALVGPESPLTIRIGPEPPATSGALKRAVRDADIVIADPRQRLRLDRDVLEAMSRCRLIQMPAVGFESVDHLAAALLQIPVANAGGFNRDAVADWTVMAILVLLRRAAWADREMRDGRWPRPMIGSELFGKTVGIIGLGNVGSAVAQRVLAFGAEVNYADQVLKNLPGCKKLEIPALFASSDVICVHAPLDDSTRGIINDAALSRMRRGAILINASRGALVDETALADALRSGQLGGAGLDVFATEPLPPDSPLRSFDNILLSPHVAGSTYEAQHRLRIAVGDNLRRVMGGLPPMNVVNGVLGQRQ